MKVEAEFTSDLFPAEPGEEELINPGRFGKKLAQFLAEGFRVRGFQVDEPGAEDWGWYIGLGGLKAPFMIGAGNMDDETNVFRVFIDPSTPTIKKFPFQKIDVGADLSQVSAALAEILESESGIRGIIWAS